MPFKIRPKCPCFTVVTLSEVFIGTQKSMIMQVTAKRCISTFFGQVYPQILGFELIELDEDENKWFGSTAVALIHIYDKISVLTGYGTPLKFDHIGHRIWMDIKQSIIRKKVLRPEFPKFQRHGGQYVSNTNPY